MAPLALPAADAGVAARAAFRGAPARRVAAAARPARGVRQAVTAQAFSTKRSEQVRHTRSGAKSGRQRSACAYCYAAVLAAPPRAASRPVAAFRQPRA